MSLTKDQIQTYQMLCVNNYYAIRSDITASCFCCLRTFPVESIRKWVDGGTTALCPHCHMDTVLPVSALCAICRSKDGTLCTEADKGTHLMDICIHEYGAEAAARAADKAVWLVDKRSSMKG